MSNEAAALKEFEPGIYIRITDVMTGIRKLARVTNTGNSYIDLDAEDCTPLPIYATLQPEEAGNILGWGLHLVDKRPELHPAWQALCDRLISSGEGTLTYNRAAHWAFTNLKMDYDQAIAAARAETDAVAGGRRILDEMAKKAGSMA
ncbi:hypothetical protein L0936_19245 [Paracidovorax citrulli]